jgi:putative tryptophan/tyrosine transport system substrate-binding protein
LLTALRQVEHAVIVTGEEVPMFGMKRRQFITLLGGATATWPLAGRAQQSHRVPRIGVLLLGTPASFAGRTQAFVEGLRDLGYVEGRTVAIEWKWGQDQIDRLPDLAAELVSAQVDVIVTGGTPTAQDTEERHAHDTHRHGDRR